MQTEKDKWIEEVLGSADHTGSAPVHDMTDMIIERVSRQTVSTTSVVWKIAASVVLLIGLNTCTIYFYHSASQGGKDSTDAASVLGLDQHVRKDHMGTVFFGN